MGIYLKTYFGKNIYSNNTCKLNLALSLLYYASPNWNFFIDYKNYKILFYICRNAFLYTCINIFGRIRYKGKSYRLKKRKKKFLDCTFGKTHWIKIYLKTMKLTRRKKNLYAFQLYSKYDFFYLRTQIKLMRPINHYTKRGLRIGRYKFKKRFGKISQAFSLLH